MGFKTLQFVESNITPGKLVPDHLTMAHTLVGLPEVLRIYYFKTIWPKWVTHEMQAEWEWDQGKPAREEKAEDEERTSIVRKA